jgi:hypothetical protein
MRTNMNGMISNVERSDFGQGMGLSWSDLNPANWFSDKPKISKDQEIKLGQAWINSLYNELKPNATYQTFIDALKLDSYNEKIPEEDYRDFLSTVGANFYISEVIANKVKDAIVSSLRNNKNGLPTRKSIISAFLNPNNIKITFWDASKITVKDFVTGTTKVATGLANFASGSFSFVNFVWKYKIPIAVGVVGLAGWFIYSNRDTIKERAKEKLLTKAGLGRQGLGL